MKVLRWIALGWLLRFLRIPPFMVLLGRINHTRNRRMDRPLPRSSLRRGRPFMTEEDGPI